MMGDRGTIGSWVLAWPCGVLNERALSLTHESTDLNPTQSLAEFSWT